MNSIKEHDRVVLTADLSGEKLAAGDVGTVVHVHSTGKAYEVEFVHRGFPPQLQEFVRPRRV